MRLVRFQVEGRSATGSLDHDEIEELGDPARGGTGGRRAVHLLGRVKLLAPCSPGKVVAVGLNYRDHAAEMGLAVPIEPIIFLKPSTSVIGPGDTIRYPGMSAQVDYEAELGVVIKDRIRNIAPHEAKDHILGYTCANDVTARDLQRKDGQWTRAKSFDTFCPIGPWIETELDPSNLLVESYLNGELRQSSRTAQLIFPVNYLVSFISRIMTLDPGDLIITGTPSGIGPMKPGDEIEVRIGGIGSLKNKVSADFGMRNAE
jgi:2-keto-4-pentenoate hydratase/2-oxohepta-3-ene-1,7-dioic acid hydratase in catechol pathway